MNTHPIEQTAPASGGDNLFAELGLKGYVLKALATEEYYTPTPIQAQAIPPVLAGRDLVGIAQTGTGKTAAFALPILQRLFEAKRRAAPRSCLALILCPTRELASQINESFERYGRFLRLSRGLVFGGVPIGKQIRALERGADIIVATPGRLLDLITRRALSLAEVEVLVLDEADHMLDLGFIHDIRKIVAMLPKRRQNLFFSATMPQAIQSLADDLLKDPVRVAVTPAARTVDKIEQSAIIVERGNKQRLLERLIGERNLDRGIVFCRTKHGADKVAKGLAAAGISAVAIHGNKSQGQRERALAALKNGETAFLVATDIAARGIDIDALGAVINFDIPDVPEAYVHRIGRTARAGATGLAIALVAPDEVRAFRDIERTMKKTVTIETHPLGTVIPERLPRPEARNQGRGGQGRPMQHARPGGFGASRHHGQREERSARPAGGRPAGDRHGQAGQPHAGQPHAGQSHAGQSHAGHGHARPSGGQPRPERLAQGHMHAGPRPEGRPARFRPERGRA